MFATLNRLRPERVIIAIWVIGLFFCVLMLLFNYKAISGSDVQDSGADNLFNPALGQVLETFAPALTLMLGFTFTPAGKKSAGATEDNSGVAFIAIALSLIYVGLFVWIIVQFYWQAHHHGSGLPLSDVNKLFETLRSKLSFLVAGSIAYYFGSGAKPNKDEKTETNTVASVGT